MLGSNPMLFYGDLFLIAYFFGKDLVSFECFLDLLAPPFMPDQSSLPLSSRSYIPPRFEFPLFREDGS